MEINTTDQDHWRRHLEELLGEWVTITATRDHAPPGLADGLHILFGRVDSVGDDHVRVLNTDLTSDMAHLADVRRVDHR